MGQDERPGRAELTGQPDPAGTLRAVRAFVLALFLAGAIGIAAELLLSEHYEDTWQVVPLALTTLGVVVLAWHGVRRGPLPLVIFRGLMLAFVASGAVGLYLHYRANTEFALESRPDLTGLPLFWKAIRGTSPPSLAPGAMSALGMLGLIWAYRHPRWTAGAGPDTDTTGALE